MDDLECDLIVFHPYRTLMALCGKEGQIAVRDAEAGEMGTGIDDGPRYWGTGEGKLELNEGAVQLAWYVADQQVVTLPLILILEFAGLSSMTLIARIFACFIHPTSSQSLRYSSL